MENQFFIVLDPETHIILLGDYLSEEEIQDYRDNGFIVRCD